MAAKLETTQRGAVSMERVAATARRSRAARAGDDASPGRRVRVLRASAGALLLAGVALAAGADGEAEVGKGDARQRIQQLAQRACEGGGLDAAMCSFHADCVAEHLTKDRDAEETAALATALEAEEAAALAELAEAEQSCRALMTGGY